MATRCSWPPDSSCGRRSAKCSPRPTRRAGSTARLCRVRAVGVEVHQQRLGHRRRRSGCGDRGSCRGPGTPSACRGAAWRRACGRGPARPPSKRTVPASGSIRRSTSRPVGRLAGPRLAHEGQRLAGVEGEATRRRHGVRSTVAPARSRRRPGERLRAPRRPRAGSRPAHPAELELVDADAAGAARRSVRDQGDGVRCRTARHGVGAAGVEAAPAGQRRRSRGCEPGMAVRARPRPAGAPRPAALGVGVLRVRRRRRGGPALDHLAGVDTR